MKGVPNGWGEGGHFERGSPSFVVSPTLGILPIAHLWHGGSWKANPSTNAWHLSWTAQRCDCLDGFTTSNGSNLNISIQIIVESNSLG